MRFMLLIKSDAKTEAGVQPDETFLAEMGRFNDALVKAGVLLGAEGLKSTGLGVRVRMGKSQGLSVLEGPFAEPENLVAGFWLIRVPSKAEAVEWAQRVPGGHGEVEVRQLYELEDFPIDVGEEPGGWRDQEEQFRDETEVSTPPRLPGTKLFIMMIKSDKVQESGALPTPPAIERMGELMGELAQHGRLVGGEGLKPSARGARIKQSGAKRSVLDGPFTEAKEMIAGYTIVQLPDIRDTYDYAKRWLQVVLDEVGTEQAELEIRELYDRRP